MTLWPGKNELSFRAIVYLNGIRQQKVICANDKAGRLLRYRVDLCGQVVFNQSELETEFFKGNVRIVDPLCVLE
jgi:hypothetical protein